MKRYVVYFSQINQTRYEVEAQTPESARLNARRLWQEENGEPDNIEVEEREEGEKHDNRICLARAPQSTG